jgi:hypothetical protein
MWHGIKVLALAPGRELAITCKGTRSSIRLVKDMNSLPNALVLKKIKEMLQNGGKSRKKKVARHVC